MVSLPAEKVSSFVAMRRRLIRETEIALTLGLLYPEHGQRIPTIEVGKGAFHPDLVARFWNRVLGLDATAPARGPAASVRPKGAAQSSDARPAARLRDGAH